MFHMHVKAVEAAGCSQMFVIDTEGCGPWVHNVILGRCVHSPSNSLKDLNPIMENWCACVFCVHMCYKCDKRRGLIPYSRRVSGLRECTKFV